MYRHTVGVIHVMFSVRVLITIEIPILQVGLSSNMGFTLESSLILFQETWSGYWRTDDWKFFGKSHENEDSISGMWVVTSTLWDCELGSPGGDLYTSPSPGLVCTVDPAVLQQPCLLRSPSWVHIIFCTFLLFSLPNHPQLLNYSGSF